MPSEAFRNIRHEIQPDVCRPSKIRPLFGSLFASAAFILSACAPSAEEKSANAAPETSEAAGVFNEASAQAPPDAPPASALTSCDPLFKEFRRARTVKLDSALDVPWYAAGYPSETLFVTELLDIDHDGRKDVAGVGQLKDGSEPPFSLLVLANLDPEIAPEAPGAAAVAKAIIGKQGNVRKVGLAFLHLNHRFSGIPDETAKLFGNTLAEVGTYRGDAVLRVNIAAVPGAPANSPTGFQALMRLLPGSSAQLLCLTASNA